MRDNLGLFLAKRSLLNPDREAIVEVERGRRFTYRQLNDRANATAHMLTRKGVSVGDRVSVLSKNCVEFVEIFFAIAKIGAVMVPLNWRLTAKELEFIVSNSGAGLLIFENEFSSVVEELQGLRTKAETPLSLVVITPDDSACDYAESYSELCDVESIEEVEIGADGDDNLFIMYTSGTTGLPKGAVHTHNTMIAASTTMNMTADYRYSDNILQILPMFHVGTITPLTCSIHRGATNIIVREFDVSSFFQTIEREQVSTGLIVAAMLKELLLNGNVESYDVSSIRWFMCGAAPVPISLIEQYAQLGVEIHQAYGLTESAGPGCQISPEYALIKKGSTGHAYFHTDVQIVREDGRGVEPGEIGEITIRGKHVMKEYWGLPEETAETIREDWLYTGDMACVDEEGFVYIQDRKKDMIISGGENIYPAEVERVLSKYTSIIDCAVVGVNSDKWGESVAAVVVSAPGVSVSDEDVLKFCRAELASYKCPKVVVFESSIPRNPSGKILKRILREKYWNVMKATDSDMSGA